MAARRSMVDSTAPKLVACRTISIAPHSRSATTAEPTSNVTIVPNPPELRLGELVLGVCRKTRIADVEHGGAVSQVVGDRERVALGGFETDRERAGAPHCEERFEGAGRRPGGGP